MAFGNTKKGTDSLPQGSVKVANITDPVPLQGSTLTSTDAAGDTTTPANLNIVQINSLAAQIAGSDGTAGSNILIFMNGLWNGGAVDQQRGNMNIGPLITAAGVTTAQSSGDQTNHNGRGVVVVLDMTTVGTGSVTLIIEGKDTTSGKYYTLLSGVAVATNVTNTYTVYPGITATANVSASNILPRVWRVRVSVNNANPTTYTVGGCLIV